MKAPEFMKEDLHASRSEVVGGKGRTVARCDIGGGDAETEAAAEFIALACNCHEELVEALEEVKHRLSFKRMNADDRAAFDKARAILNKTRI